MRILTIGARGPEVTFLQRLLNKRGAEPYVTEDGIFGPATHRALVAFQHAQQLPQPHGTATATTWNRFGTLMELVHPVTPFAQPSDMSCWSAAATIILGNQSVGSGRARIGSDGGLPTDLPNIDTFVRGLGWRIVNNMTRPPASQLLATVSRAPAWVVFQGLHFAHAVVFSGVYTDGAPDGTGTVFRVQDPWPPGRGTGSMYGTTYLGHTLWLRSTPRPQPAMIAYVAQR